MLACMSRFEEFFESNISKTHLTLWTNNVKFWLRHMEVLRNILEGEITATTLYDQIKSSTDKECRRARTEVGGFSALYVLVHG